uniref:Uncharacterized protein n=1 Tax=Rhizophora mucronata TaxID=61149 RepID=A0A2P2JXL7_RHIMU
MKERLYVFNKRNMHVQLQHAKNRCCKLPHVARRCIPPFKNATSSGIIKVKEAIYLSETVIPDSRLWKVSCHLSDSLVLLKAKHAQALLELASLLDSSNPG